MASETSANNKQVIIYGGAFNPPTIAHKTIIDAVLNSGYESIWLMPSGWRTDKSDVISDEQRLKMLRVLVDECWPNDERVCITDFELRLAQPTETYDTMTELKKAYPGTDFIYLLGADSFSTINEWENGEELLRDTQWLVVRRHGYEDLTLPTNARWLNANVSDISSTEVRNRLRNGKSITELVTQAIEDYIKRKKLYI